MLVDVPVGTSPAGGACSVVTVVMLDNGKGDRSAESSGVKVSVGWGKVQSDPLGRRANRQAVAQLTFVARLTVKIAPRITIRRKQVGSRSDAQKYLRMVYNHFMRTNIDINESLVRKARKLTRLKTKRQIVDKALELLVRSESRKGILQYYGSGIWKGDSKAMRRNRV
jgi:Arc/MetJ family transcription regulator